MPGAGRSESALVRIVGVIVALLALVGYLAFGWSFDGSGTAVTTAIGSVVAPSAIGWVLYNRFETAGGDP